jgi:Rrf2 family protein
MIEIALNDPDKGVFQKDISKNQEISNKYLDHIIYALKTSQLVTNLKGKKSGYILTRRPSEITIYDIHCAFEPGICIIECQADNFQCSRAEGCRTRGFWGGLNNMIVDYFKSITLQDLLENKLKIEV